MIRGRKIRTVHICINHAVACVLPLVENVAWVEIQYKPLTWQDQALDTRYSFQTVIVKNQSVE